MTNKELKNYIEENVRFKKNVMDNWEAYFVFADGYRCSTSSPETGTVVKSQLKQILVERVLELSTKHLIKPQVEVKAKDAKAN